MSKSRKRDITTIIPFECYHVQFSIEGLPKIPSINGAYKPGRRRRGFSARIFKTERTSSFQELLLEKIHRHNIQIKNTKLKTKYRLSLAFIFYIDKSTLYKRDVSNFVKGVEDIFSKALGVDDRYVVCMFIKKVPITVPRIQGTINRNVDERIDIFCALHHEKFCKGESCEQKSHFLNFVKTIM